MAKPNDLYNDLIDITHDYLGPAAKRFIDRHIESHLQKEPRKVSKKDLGKLIKWIKVSVAMLTDDQKLKNEYASRLKELAGNGYQESH